MIGKELRFLATPEKGEVSALLVRPEHSSHLLVLGHGASTNMRHANLQTIAERMADVGIATFRYNFPYMEHGKGRDSQAVCTQTVRAAVAAAREAAPSLPVLAGGHSFGGRMTSTAASSKSPLDGVSGLVFFAFPLHQPGKPETKRAEHLGTVTVPMLFLSGTRDDLADMELLKPVCKKLGKRTTLHALDTADHGFKTLKRARTSAEDVFTEMARVRLGLGVEAEVTGMARWLEAASARPSTTDPPRDPGSRLFGVMHERLDTEFPVQGLRKSHFFSRRLAAGVERSRASRYNQAEARTSAVGTLVEANAMSQPEAFQVLIERVRAGDAEAATELVRRYEPMIRRAARVRLVDQRLARLLDSMDICQSVMASFFVRAALGQYELNSPDQLLRLLATMARNKLANHAHSQRAARRDVRRTEGGQRRGGGSRRARGYAEPAGLGPRTSRRGPRPLQRHGTATPGAEARRRQLGRYRRRRRG